MNENFNKGTIEVVVGAMFSEKSLYLLEKCKKHHEVPNLVSLLKFRLNKFEEKGL